MHFLGLLNKGMPCIAKYASQNPAHWQIQADQFHLGTSASTTQCTTDAKHVCFPNKEPPEPLAEPDRGTAHQHWDFAVNSAAALLLAPINSSLKMDL